jgi:ParB family transcriptional regulator, chromosome partitioning protein
MKIATEEEIAAEEAKKKEQAIEFIHLPLNQIVAAGQIRHDINMNSESFTGLMESIRDRGVLEPLLVARQDDGNFLLIVGERRFRACQKLNLPTVPVRIVGRAATKEDIITLQLIENLDRENLDPIDEANAYLEFLRTKTGAIGPAGIISLIMTYDRDPERVEKAFAANFAAISKITGKSTRSMINMFSLLTLPTPFQAALREGKIGLSQGYLFAANPDNPKLYEIFDAILKKPVTYLELKKLLDKAAGKGKKTRPRVPFSGFYSNIKTVRTAFEKGKAAFSQQDLEKLATELETFCAMIKEQARKQTAVTTR